MDENTKKVCEELSRLAYNTASEKRPAPLLPTKSTEDHESEEERLSKFLRQVMHRDG